MTDTAAIAEETPPTVDKSPERVREMFGQIAPRYDLLNHLLSLNIDRYWRWRAVRALPLAGDVPMLDLCTGTGDLAFAFARAGRGMTPVIGADFCHPMLVGARRKAARRVIAPQAFVEADAMQLPFASNQFQVVSVAFGLRNVADTDVGLAEMARVCRVGGKVAVLEFSTPTWRPFGAVYTWYFKNVLPRIGQWLARNRFEAYRYLPASVGEFPCGEALAERMRAAGLADVVVRPLTFGVATLYIGTKGPDLS
ncbi:MAG: bifunctional demethylmenaquinone methyltransferase/2-methoxy-6-polyprenyl-1,4-benzoquinol methylase UbiE [Planctomycetales bacterium]|nr:bifunctional demethylmenaquinone methyltransferase/2-methoxy-6-polyprenyl-1,4-benzoquinol methylase UbiE [Planctomycetales bacterium]